MITLWNKLIEIFLKLGQLKDILDKPIKELTTTEAIMVAGTLILAFFFLKWFFKNVWKYTKKGAEILKAPFKKIHRHIKRRIREKYTCPVCRNPLEKCTCSHNRGKLYRQRKRNHRKWIREHRLRLKLKKLAEKRLKKEQAKANKPVPLKTKTKKEGGNKWHR